MHEVQSMGLLLVFIQDDDRGIVPVGGKLGDLSYRVLVAISMR